MVCWPVSTGCSPAVCRYTGVFYCVLLVACRHCHSFGMLHCDPLILQPGQQASFGAAMLQLESGMTQDEINKCSLAASNAHLALTAKTRDTSNLFSEDVPRWF